MINELRSPPKLKVIKEEINQAIEKGTLLDLVDQLVTERKKIDENYIKLLKHAYNKTKNSSLDKEKKNLLFTKMLDGLKQDEIWEPFVKNAQKAKVNFKNQSSFRANMIRNTRKRQLGKFHPEWILDKKLNAFTFIDELGTERPRVSQQKFSLLDIPNREGLVIKPNQGSSSNGVYLVINNNEIRDVKRARFLTDREQLQNSMEEDLESGIVKEDLWIIEELVFEDEDAKLPARDLKFFCFYGKPALILEVVRYPETKYCWWTVDGKMIDTGKYNDKLFNGKGVTQEMIQEASYISSEIPCVFLRIDFLKTSNGMKFGEFTLRPGLFEQFNNSTDQMLGDYYLEAEGRLMNDLLNGKDFKAFTKAKELIK
ncbi:hypothetical protein BTS2_1900 [Bacillus sp. TS-2]|nr:hypothetical protein BTS2_1900 [Bacillus sp. TS-2]